MDRLLTVKNTKTTKGEKLGILTGILYLAPANESGVMNTSGHLPNPPARWAAPSAEANALRAWSARGHAYATGEALYALHLSGNVAINDPAYQKGVQWLLRNQLADGSWFVPTRAVPVQPHTFESFPNGWHQFVSEAGSCWSAMALLFTLPDKPKSTY